ncbi:hypothetical protein Pla175_02410 [Pirellulimonas nuda]|uniref:Uncharacterized protein n=1 Tax=Pirellulimonas nuda TaxID=2528009 RepID=A0A518D5Z0_9BACT|nr:hypothetical protein Pla175_02410 [Pirellulimonas nuda]
MAVVIDSTEPEPRESIPTTIESILGVLEQTLTEASIYAATDIDNIASVMEQIDSPLIRKINRIGANLLATQDGRSRLPVNILTKPEHTQSLNDHVIRFAIGFLNGVTHRNIDRRSHGLMDLESEQSTTCLVKGRVVVLPNR